MHTVREPDHRPTARNGWIGLAYYLAYLAWLFRRPENEAAHWLTMVLIPLAIAWLALPRGTRGLRAALASVGLRRGNLRRGVGWALLVGVLFTVFQVFAGGHAEAIQALFRSGRAFWLLPFSFAMMLVLAGFTEEFLFRGFIQTRLEALFRSRWAAVLVTAFLFGVYHLPYAYLNPRWPSHGEWGAAWTAALGNGMPGGLVLGALYVVSRGNLLALHCAPFAHQRRARHDPDPFRWRLTCPRGLSP